ncbi:MAG TPA: sulfatase-like hydrolase/transferase [Phycisphaerae bacterium]|nr:sulfatase-like hydrolase/transferase [Phycisphaerae bacterium]
MRRPAKLWLPVVLLFASPLVQARPLNVLMIVGDDHQNDVVGCYGNKLARTPSLDRLAAQGARFDRAYCNTPICTPSRQSFLCGRYPQAVGVTSLTQALDDDQITLAERLRGAGYRTAAFGKMHFNSPKSHGFEVFKPEPAWYAWRQSQPRRTLPEGIEVFPEWKPFRDPARIWLNGINRPQGLYDDEMAGTWYAREAVAFMKENRDRPFFVQIGFHEPHSPFWFPVDFNDCFRPEDMPVPKPGPEDAGQIPKVFADLTDDDKRGIIASAYTSVAYLDKNIGRVLDAVDSLGLADDTLVIYIGDNGYHLGQHGRFEKHSFFERAVRVPLIIRLPGKIKPGTETAALAELVDLVPTVLDYLGLPADRNASPPRDLHGHSLRLILDGTRQHIRDTVFSEYRHTEEIMARTDRWKLIYRSSRAVVDWYEPVETLKGRSIRLYDQLNDPEEMHNVAADPANAAVVKDLLARMADFYKRVPPRGETPPAGLATEDFLDWAIAQRNAATAPAK